MKDSRSFDFAATSRETLELVLESVQQYPARCLLWGHDAGKVLLKDVKLQTLLEDSTISLRPVKLLLINDDLTAEQVRVMDGQQTVYVDLCWHFQPQAFSLAGVSCFSSARIDRALQRQHTWAELLFFDIRNRAKRRWKKRLLRCNSREVTPIIVSEKMTELLLDGYTVSPAGIPSITYCYGD